ncbi:per-hexamer repeat protein 5, putative [Anopheles sinensis]|uniref:Per-hexamer repeat protein 5, putative n=1 Tax=Anopheles sinensis TaxID=74873 RepID=A0A084VKH4_ANOSI|nr:per-hexamer repeat protein 5, putative [Anopheles sinensis]
MLKAPLLGVLEDPEEGIQRFGFSYGSLSMTVANAANRNEAPHRDPPSALPLLEHKRTAQLHENRDCTRRRRRRRPADVARMVVAPTVLIICSLFIMLFIFALVSTCLHFNPTQPRWSLGSIRTGINPGGCRCSMLGMQSCGDSAKPWHHQPSWGTGSKPAS